MRMFVCWPTSNIEQSNATAREWARMGWKVAVAVDRLIPEHWLTPANVVSHINPLRIGEYKGYYDVMRFMVRELAKSYQADIVVAGADNILPDPNARAVVVGAAFATKFPSGFGVMQPIGVPWRPEQSGDRASETAFSRKMHATEAYENRCESPVLGKAFILESYNGKGPWLEDKYHQYFGDVELHDVAQRMGVLWKSKELMHRRVSHWAQEGGPSMKTYQTKNFDAWYEKDLAKFKARKYKEYPDSERKGKVIVPSNDGIVLP